MEKGITGTIVLGNYAKIFTALPEYYTLTDFDIHIEDSTDSYQNVQSLRAISGELVKSGVADLEDITNLITASSTTELKKYIEKSIARKKEENNIITQLQQQVQQYEQNSKELQKINQQLQQQLQQVQNQLQTNNQAKLELEAQKVALEKERIQNEKEYNDKVIETKKQQVDIQAAETVDSNPYNDKIKSVI